MKTLILLTAMLAGCATGYSPFEPQARWQTTAPGYELPAFMDWCKEATPQGLCTKWANGSGVIRVDPPPKPPLAN